HMHLGRWPRPQTKGPSGVDKPHRMAHRAKAIHFPRSVTSIYGERGNRHDSVDSSRTGPGKVVAITRLPACAESGGGRRDVTTLGHGGRVSARANARARGNGGQDGAVAP